MSVNLDAVARLFQNVVKFEGMTPREQAAYRATLTRFRNEVTDPEILAELSNLQEMIGESETASRARVTVDDVEQEFPQFLGYDTRQRAAYKSKVTRMLNEATEAGQIEVANRLGVVIRNLASAETQEAKARIMRLAKGLKS